MFVATYNGASIYMLKFDPSGLVCKRYVVNREWMLTIAYYRGRLEAYKDTPIVKEIAQARDGIDYIIAPIADNRMFEIIDSFIDGEITDVQCQHCLSATNPGMQYVFVSNNALQNVTLLERCYLADIESVMELAGLTMEELADVLGVSRVTVSNWINRKTTITEKHMNAFYRYAFSKGIRLNRIVVLFQTRKL